MKAILTCLIFILFCEICEAQINHYFDCAMTDPGTHNLFQGRYKPERTDMSGGAPLTDTTAVFPVLIVFVQFQNDLHGDVWWWERGEAPTFIDSLIRFNRSNNPNEWWNAYNQNNKEYVSDYWHEMTRGHLHVVGEAHNIILDHDTSWYRQNGGYKKINQEIYEKLKALGTINWERYDQWRWEFGNFIWEPDGKIDMIYKIHRSHPGNTINMHTSAWGIAYLGEATGDTTEGYPLGNGKYINGGFYESGSGITLAGKFGVPNRTAVLHGVGHEVGHYLFTGGGINYALMTHYRPGDFRFSPWESIKMGWMGPQTVNFANQDYELEDFSSYHNDSIAEVLQVPIVGTNSEFFLLASRRNVSKWDKVMLGDTAHDDALRPINSEYGKGLYIYHITNAYLWENDKNMDLECADGLYNWTQDGWDAPDWNTSSPYLPVIKKVSVSYNNDNGKLGDSYNTIINDKDGKSVGGRTDSNALELKWFSYGKKQSSQGGDGIDRLYTNDNEPWTSREGFGDRWDAWNVGYNEIFSPYSSPSTDKWDNDTSQIFIWYYGESHDVASIKVYRVGHGSGYNESQILELTPPSKPMGLKDTTCVLVNNYNRPTITWNHNMEPDMIRGGGFVPEFKRYKIYRSKSNDLSTQVPDQPHFPEDVYTHIATVDIGVNTKPTYVDTSLISACYLPDGQCPPYCWIQYPIRYRVQAVDEYDDTSVLSDFASTTGIRLDGSGPGGNEEDHPVTGNDIPTVFDLKQNFPNPFNPSTNIQYDLPKDVHVSIKVYDMSGREMAVLVNDFRNAGRYIVAFNASHLASGIYFYKIKAGGFEVTKRMVLLK